MKCFEYHKNLNKECKKQSCRYWLENKSGCNCTLITSNKGPLTLQKIGNIFGITRMRVCQIEKKILEKLKSQIKL